MILLLILLYWWFISIWCNGSEKLRAQVFTGDSSSTWLLKQVERHFVYVTLKLEGFSSAWLVLTYWVLWSQVFFTNAPCTLLIPDVDKYSLIYLYLSDTVTEDFPSLLQNIFDTLYIYLQYLIRPSTSQQSTSPLFPQKINRRIDFCKKESATAVKSLYLLPQKSRIQMTAGLWIAFLKCMI